MAWLWIWLITIGMIPAVWSHLRIQVVCPKNEILRKSIMQQKDSNNFHVECVNSSIRELRIIFCCYIHQFQVSTTYRMLEKMLFLFFLPFQA